MALRVRPRQKAADKAKHGIDFEEAQALWDDPDNFFIPSRRSDEPRFLMIGAIEGKVWAAIIAYRGENVRLISVRRARDDETEAYQSRRTR